MHAVQSCPGQTPFKSPHTGSDCTRTAGLHSEAVHDALWLQALSWRRLRMSGSDVWYNWRANRTQHETPDEMPQYLLDEVRGSCAGSLAQ